MLRCYLHKLEVWGSVSSGNPTAVRYEGGGDPAVLMSVSSSPRCAPWLLDLVEPREKINDEKLFDSAWSIKCH